MNLEGFFDVMESPPFMFWAFWASLCVLASFVVYGVLRAAGRG